MSPAASPPKTTSSWSASIIAGRPMAVSRRPRRLHGGLRWMRDRGADIGGDASRILVCGDSAGGNLAAALPLRAREERLSILATVLLCPLTDFHFEKFASYERLAPTGVVIDASFMGFARGAYLTKSQQWRDPWASPALGDLNGYPRTLLDQRNRRSARRRQSRLCREIEGGGRGGQAFHWRGHAARLLFLPRRLEGDRRSLRGDHEDSSPLRCKVKSKQSPLRCARSKAQA